MNIHKGENNCNFSSIQKFTCKIQSAAEFKGISSGDCFSKSYQGTEKENTDEKVFSA